MANKPDVLIVGGGVIGAACAYELAHRGVSTTMIDKGQVGFGCSYGNAGWITPCLAFPLPMPGMLTQSIKWLVDPDSPLYIKPRASWNLIRWLWRFLISMNEPHMRQSMKALTELALYSLERFKQLEAEHPGAFGYSKNGIVMAAQTAAGKDEALREMELAAQHGIPGRAMDARQIRELEPSITNSNVCGGVFFPDQAHVEPLATVQTLAERAKARGAKIMPRTEVIEFILRGRCIDAVRTTQGLLQADQIVLATGSWSAAVGRRLGLRVPVLSGKGYAVIVEPFSPAPSRPILLTEKKIAVTPRKDTIRLAGTLELVDLDESITVRRVEAILRGARQYLSLPEQPKVVEIWRGLRPCTPDGVPIIGRPEKFDNLVIATGHQMLGLLTAPGTGRLVADMITGEKPIFDPYPFRATRF